MEPPGCTSESKSKRRICALTIVTHVDSRISRAFHYQGMGRGSAPETGAGVTIITCLESRNFQTPYSIDLFPKENPIRTTGNYRQYNSKFSGVNGFMVGVYPKLNTCQTQAKLAVEQAMGAGLMNPLEVSPDAGASEEHGLIHPSR